MDQIRLFNDSWKNCEIFSSNHSLNAFNAILNIFFKYISPVILALLQSIKSNIYDLWEVNWWLTDESHWPNKTMWVQDTVINVSDSLLAISKAIFNICFIVISSGCVCSINVLKLHSHTCILYFQCGFFDIASCFSLWKITQRWLCKFESS